MTAFIDSLFLGTNIGIFLAILLVGVLWLGAKAITFLDQLETIPNPIFCAILIFVFLAFR